MYILTWGFNVKANLSFTVMKPFLMVFYLIGSLIPERRRNFKFLIFFFTISESYILISLHLSQEENK